MSLPELDTAFFFFINKGLQNTLFDVAMPFVTQNGKLLFLALVIWTFFNEGKKAWYPLAVALTAVALADGSGHLLKDLFARPRPCHALENINLLVGCGGSFSMPSNHASNAFGFAMVYWFLRKNAVTPFFVLVAALVAFSRVYIGVHYPFDVVAGGLLGVLASYASVLLYRRAVFVYEKKYYEQALYLVIFAFSLFRIYYILTTPMDLSPDEAHYWEWSRRLDLSYYSKGPMIAYLIRLGTLIFGSTAFGVRIPAVVFSALSSLVMYKLGRELYDEKTGFMSALLVQIVPLFSIFGVLFTIDSPFIFFWVLSLYLFYKATRGMSEVQNIGSPKTAGNSYPAVIKSPLIYWTLLGVSVGLGLLTKYTMAFFYLCALLYFLFRDNGKNVRKLPLFRSRSLLYFCISTIISLLVFSPVIAWNAANGWVTVRHTAGQAHLADGLTVTPKNFLEFTGSQAGVVTPVLFVLILIALWRLRKEREGAFLFWFSVPVLLFFTVKSIQGKVQGNWALAGYASGFIAFSAFYMRNLGLEKKPVKVLVSAALTLAFALTIAAHYPSALHLPPKMDLSKRFTGWKELGLRVSDIYAEMSSEGPLFVFSDKYQISSELAFYMKGNPITYCVNLGRRMNQYDLWPGFERLAGYNAIFVSSEEQKMPDTLLSAFSRYDTTKLELKTRKNKTMKFTLFKCYDFKGINSQPAETY